MSFGLVSCLSLFNGKGFALSAAVISQEEILNEIPPGAEVDKSESLEATCSDNVLIRGSSATKNFRYSGDAESIVQFYEKKIHDLGWYESKSTWLVTVSSEKLGKFYEKKFKGRNLGLTFHNDSSDKTYYLEIQEEPDISLRCR